MASAFGLHSAVPWGRGAWEYRAFFGLDEMPVAGPILDCAAGPSSFVAEMHAAGRSVIAADPLYAHSGDAIERQFEAAGVNMKAGMRTAHDRFDWSVYGSEAQVLALRRDALRRFLADYEDGKSAGRYVPAELPHLPFADASFRLALCSHFLFLYGDLLSFDFHLASVRALMAVAAEVRIFPLLNLNGRPSAHEGRLRRKLAMDGFWVERIRVRFEFQKGATHMLRITRR